MLDLMVWRGSDELYASTRNADSNQRGLNTMLCYFNIENDITKYDANDCECHTFSAWTATLEH
jgi:hypothetical protein